MWASCETGLLYQVSFILGDCWYSFRDIFSFVLGCISLLSWISVGIPQFIENIKHQEAESLQTKFLLIWLAADLCNVFGCIFADQLSTQLFVAIWFCVMDFILIFQQLYYRKKNKQLEDEKKKSQLESQLPLMGSFSKIEYESLRGLHLNPGSEPKNVASPNKNGNSFLTSPRSYSYKKSNLSPSSGDNVSPSNISPNWRLYGILWIILTLWKTIDIVFWNQNSNYVHSGRQLFEYNPTHGLAMEIVGIILGSVAYLLYVSSRFPQIISNFRYRTTEELSIPIFILCLCANLSYFLSILIREIDTTTMHYKFPWVIGSFLAFLLDLIIFFQYQLYKNQDFS